MTGIKTEDIKAKYPQAVRTTERSKGYCVGGAFLMFWTSLAEDRSGFYSDERFPSYPRLAWALQQANPKLSNAVAYSFAVRIAQCNDREEFDVAWDALDRALRFEQEACPISEPERQEEPELVGAL